MAIGATLSTGSVPMAGATGVSSIKSSEDQSKPGDYWTLSKCKKAYLDYLGNKRLEIDEQQEARRYRHGSHWTAAQIAALNLRKQPVVTYNRIGRKIDGIVGLVEKLRQDPKAYPRTPQHEEGADLATAVLRYAMDKAEWEAKSPLCAESGAVDGIGGIELELVDGQNGDKDVTFEVVDVDGFFYDPTSFKMDFSDATFMGVGKWLNPDVAKELMPDKAEEIDSSNETGADLSTNSDRDNKWFFTDGERKRIRLVDIWYRHKGNWCWAIFTGSHILMEGKSYFVDDKQKTTCKFIMYSACVDQDGDRYGFVRNLKSANDEINQRRSKGLHELSTRRVIARSGHFTDVEEARRQAARPDGFLLWDQQGASDPGPIFDDAAKNANIQGQMAFLEDAKREIENFAGYSAQIETGANVKSGRAIALMQQQAVSDLGPYIIAYKGWKLRVYRGIFNAIRANWTAERWILVTDNDDLAEFVQINGMQTDPNTGMPTMVNAIGQLDVDIKIDEGPDAITQMQDMYETLSNVVPSIAPMLQPAEARAIVKMMIDTSPLAGAQKKAYREATEQAAQPDPADEALKRITIEGEAAKVEETQSKSILNMSKARAEGMPDAPGQPEQMEFELPPEVQIAQAAAEINEKDAGAEQKRAMAFKANLEAMLAPQKMRMEAENAQRDRMERVAFKGADMKAQDADRKIAARKPKS